MGGLNQWSIDESSRPNIWNKTFIWPNGLLLPSSVPENSYLFFGSRTASQTRSYAVATLSSAARWMRVASRGCDKRAR